MRVLRIVRLPPAFWLFAGLFGAGEIVQARRGDALFPLVEAALLGILCWLTARLTERNATSARRGRFFALQLAACLFVVVATGLSGAVFNHVIPVSAGMPLWQPLSSNLLAVLARHMPPPFTTWGVTNGVRNLVFDALPLSVVLVLCGLRLRDLGLGPFRAGFVAVALLWLTVPVVGFVTLVLTRHVGIALVGLSWLSNLLQNGFTEELLWRGLILGRIRALLGSDWGLVVQALLFGAWHYGADASLFHGNATYAVAQMLVNQALFGYAMGFVALRSGNVLIGSAFHCLGDAMGDFAWLSNSPFSLF